MKLAEEALRENEERLRALYDSMTEGLANYEVVYVAGEPVDYVITDVNPAFERITGLARSGAVGLKASELYGSPPYLDIFARVAASGVPEDFETYFPPLEKHFTISVFSPERENSPPYSPILPSASGQANKCTCRLRRSRRLPTPLSSPGWMAPSNGSTRRSLV